jgi:hypothetical protein
MTAVLSLLLVAGCDHTPSPPAVPKSSPATPVVRLAPKAKHDPEVKADAVKNITWTKSIVPGGFMFQDEAAFRDYVRGSEIVAVGTWTSSGDGRNGRVYGTLHVERALSGPADADIDLYPTGGFLPAEPGQRVIALLSTQRGKLKLNSFCAASGLYRYSRPLEAYIEETLQLRPL